MKKIGKLSINPEKVIKNEELVNLRGGQYECYCCHTFMGTTELLGIVLLSSSSDCKDDCVAVYTNSNIFWNEENCAN